MTPDTPKEIAVRNHRMLVSDSCSELPGRFKLKSIAPGGGGGAGGMMTFTLCGGAEQRAIDGRDIEVSEPLVGMAERSLKPRE